jgi:DNA-binding NtrC family response regulator
VRVLVVDDDAGIRETLGVMLRDEGYEVYEAVNGVDALQQMQATTEPMVTLLDMWMPLMSGEDTLFAAATQTSLWNRLAFIVITANPQRLSERAQTLIEDSRIPLLLKPFDIDTLAATVQAAANGLAGASGRSM